MQLKQELSMPMKLVPTDAIIMINNVWSNSFSNVQTDKNVISSRGSSYATKHC